MVTYILIRSENTFSDDSWPVILAAAFTKSPLEQAIKGYIEQYLEAYKERYTFSDSSIAIDAKEPDNVRVEFYAECRKRPVVTAFYITEVPVIDAA